MMMRTAIARDLGFRSAFPAAEDRDFLCRFLAAHHSVRLNEELLTVYRSHDVSDSAPQTTRALVTTATDQLGVNQRYAHLTPRPRHVLGGAHRRLALALIDDGRWREARPHLRGWWRNKPDSLRALRLLARSYFARG
jgi:hypothetical protein